MKINQLNIGGLKPKYPIIQGGMGIGVSGSKLSSAVAREGGIGIISGVQMGYKEDDFEKNPFEANVRAMRHAIREAKANSNGGIIGINFMVAGNKYNEFVEVAVEEGIDLIISGAGLPLQLPELVKGSSTRIAPIVSSGKAARIIMKRWLRHDRLPDAIVVEGPLAGGHLGFKPEQLTDETVTLEEIVADVLEVVAKVEKEHNVEIPVIAAGGLMTGQDIKAMLKLGAAGVQMGSRFVATHECDAHDAFKEAYINSTPEQVRLIISPVGLPGRGIENNFMQKTDAGPIKVKKCYNCIGHCNPATTPYCISQALIDSVKGEDGLVFSGARAHEIKEIISVKELMKELMEDLIYG